MSLIRGGAAWDLYFYLGPGVVDTIFRGGAAPSLWSRKSWKNQEILKLVSQN